MHSARTVTIAGLPVRTALFYAFLFVIAFWTYRALWKDAPLQASDSRTYLSFARDLSDLRVDRLHNRPPGYPFFLVLTGSSHGPTRALFYSSLVLHFASVWLLGAVLYALGLTGMWLNLFALLLALPPYVESAAYILTENLSEFLLVAAFSALVFWFRRNGGTRLLIISAVAVAYSGLTRPTYQVLALAIAGFLLMTCRVVSGSLCDYRKLVRASLTLITVSVLLIGGFSLLNYLEHDFFGIYPMTGFNLSTRTVNVLERLPDEYAAVREALIKARDAELIRRNGEHTAYLSYWDAMPDLVKATGLEEGPQLSQYMLRLNLLLIRKAPLNYLQEVLTSFSGYWLPSTTPLANMDSLTVQALWVVMQLGLVVVFALQLLVIVGLMLFNWSQRVLLATPKPQSVFSGLPPWHAFTYALAGTLVLYTALATCLVEVGTPRYRVPTESLIVFMCFMGLHLWWRLIIGIRTSDERQDVADP